MMIKLVIPNQTLAELCDELRLENPDYLRSFHNQNCHPTECFEGNSIDGKRILVPTKNKIAKINQKNQGE